MSFTVYILECADGTLYTGSTNDLAKRLHQHNHLNSGAKYTRQRRPVKLVYKKVYKTFHQARKKEAEIKKLRRSEKKKIIRQKLQKLIST